MTDPGSLFGPVTADLEAVEIGLRREIESDPAVVARPMLDLFEAGGKRIRPALVLLSASVGARRVENLLPAAMAVELTHAATLVHDDVIDRSAVRRGRPTVAAQLGDEPAIVVGDFYFAKAYELAARTESPQVVLILAHAVMNICAGEVRQQSVRRVYSTGVDEYMRRIEAKTATLLAACCEIGSHLAGLDARQKDSLCDYGRQLGLAFQIADDVLDYIGTEGEVGKPIGHDIAEGFATLPVMLATRDVPTAEKLGAILVEGRKLSDEQAAEVVRLVRASHGPEAALERARDHSRAAKESLRTLPRNKSVETLAALADYVVSRKL